MWPEQNHIMIVLSFLLIIMTTTTSCQRPESGLKFNQDTSTFSGLTFSFDPRLDKPQVDSLHHERFHSILHKASSILYETLNGRAYLGEVRVLIPYKWRHNEWPLMHKPGEPIIANRHLRFTDSDVIVGQEDPLYKETPFSLQHDECGRPGK